MQSNTKRKLNKKNPIDKEEETPQVPNKQKKAPQVPLTSHPSPLTPVTIAVKVKAKAESSIRKQHPWVFESAITKISQEPKAGDLAIIYSQKKNKLLALGLFDPSSPIRIKLIQFVKGAKIDAAWFYQKIQTAYEKRIPLLQTDTNSFRFIHGENDGLPDLIVDVYAGVAVVKLYSEIWFSYLSTLVDIIAEIAKVETVVLRLNRKLENIEAKLLYKNGQILKGVLENEEILFKEHSLLFSANVVKGHKTGFFLDHRHNRKRIGELANGKTVLDLFAYAGGFSVHALAGGANEVTSLDISSHALEMAKANVALNSKVISQKSKHKTMAIDVFKGLQQLHQERKQFDLIIVDPPSFAKKASEVSSALNSYRRLTKNAVLLMKKGGIILLASCSSRVGAELFFETVEKAMLEVGVSFKLLDKTIHDSDHPIGFPEGAYLKSGYYLIQ